MLCLYAFAVILYFTVILYRIGSECLLQRKIQYMKWQKTLGRGEHQRTEKTESIDSVHLAGMLPVCWREWMKFPITILCRDWCFIRKFCSIKKNEIADVHRILYYFYMRTLVYFHDQPLKKSVHRYLYRWQRYTTAETIVL